MTFVHFEELAVDKRFTLHSVAPEAIIFIFHSAFMRNFRVAAFIIDAGDTKVNKTFLLSRSTPVETQIGESLRRIVSVQHENCFPKWELPTKVTWEFSL